MSSSTSQHGPPHCVCSNTAGPCICNNDVEIQPSRLCRLCTDFRNRGETPNASSTFSDLLEFDCQFCDQRRTLQGMLPYVEEPEPGNALHDVGARILYPCLLCRNFCYPDHPTTRPASYFPADCEICVERLRCEALDSPPREMVEINGTGVTRVVGGWRGALPTQETLERSKFFAAGVVFSALVLILFD
ncbi:hypothetical protein VTL71DRAFT_214 [Oculimacula yallundae]|uniref:Uncharacterized protein n=1 Tax=Oculimacula yallundae TaxID=86028 RepID=A0ABR4D1N5_9HELO